MFCSPHKSILTLVSIALLCAVNFTKAQELLSGMKYALPSGKSGSRSTQLDIASYGRYDSIPVLEFGDTLKNPWAGGLNTPQFSHINLNGDAFPDLFVFDRDGSEARCFVNTGKRDRTNYVHAPEFEAAFPRMINYAQLYDYNNDGKEDLFTSFQSGDYRVFMNESSAFEADSTKFRKLHWKNPNDSNTYVDFLTYKYFIAGGPDYIYTNVYVLNTDIAALVDVDYDGDMDILSFGNQTNAINLFENMSMDYYGNSDSLEFRDKDVCWGQFTEDVLTFKLNLESCQGRLIGAGSKNDPSRASSRPGSRHEGSTVFINDLNGDSLPDILLGDVSFNNMIAGYNYGNVPNAKITKQDTTFPFTDKPVDVMLFPAAFYIDVNNDRVKDLVVAPNSFYNFENKDQVHYYKNRDSDNRVLLQYQRNDFLVGSMIDMGSNSHPVLVDVNGDSLLDIIVGSFGKWNRNYSHTSQLAYFKNIGDSADPAFELVDSAYLSVSDSGLFPAFGDLDGDGDKDLLLTNYRGEVKYYENQASSPNDSMELKLTSASFDTLQLGIGASPFLYDVNHDGKLDLLCGSEHHGIKYFPNTASSGIAIYSYANYVKDFCQIQLHDDQGRGFNTVFMSRLDSSGKLDSNGKEYLFVGQSNGEVSLWGDIDTGGTIKATELNKTFLYAQMTSISGGDLTADGKPDLIYGQKMGGVSVLLKDGGNIIKQPNPDPEDSTKDTTKSVYQTPDPNMQIKVFPNPATDQVSLSIENARSPVGISILDIAGRMFFTGYFENGEHQIDLANLPEGLFLLTAKEGEATYFHKLIKTSQ